MQHLKELNPYDQLFSGSPGSKRHRQLVSHCKEYTEKFLHQQQIRDAVSTGIMTKELYYPFLDTLIYAFPMLRVLKRRIIHRYHLLYRQIREDNGT